MSSTRKNGDALSAAIVGVEPVRREQLAWLIERAARVTGDDDLVVIGSQAILASYSDIALPTGLTMSIEADIATFADDDNQKADAIDWVIGEGSEVQGEYGIYAQGVSLTTPTAPADWRDRLVPLSAPDPSNAVGWCLEVHDLCVAKLAAGREKDLEFVELVVTHHLADPVTLHARGELLDTSTELIDLVIARVDRLASRGVDGQGRQQWWRNREAALRERFSRVQQKAAPGASTTLCAAPVRGGACTRPRADCQDAGHAAWRTTQPRD